MSGQGRQGFPFRNAGAPSQARHDQRLTDAGQRVFRSQRRRRTAKGGNAGRVIPGNAERIQRIHLLAHRTVQAGIPRVQAHSILSLRFRCLHLRQDLLQCHLRAVVNLYPRPRVFQQGRVHQAARVDHHVRALQQRRPPQRDQIRRAGAGTHKMHHVRFLLSCL